MFLRAEQSGLKLAIIGRIAALVLMGIWLIGTRADDPARALGYVLVLSLFAALGVAHYALCKEHGTSLLLSATTANALPEAKLIAVGNIAVRGFAEPVTVFSVRTDDGGD